MLMSKSQLHPVINPAAAGGKMIATYSNHTHPRSGLLYTIKTFKETYENEKNIRTPDSHRYCVLVVRLLSVKL